MPNANAHTDRERPARRRLRLGGAALVLLAVAGASVLGWRWHRRLPVRRVVVAGAAHAAPGALVRLAHVRLGEPLYRLQPRLVADRVRRAPWVKDARVTRSPDGTLRIAVTERTPAALVLQAGGEGAGDADGEPAYYLDAEGYPLPLVHDSTAAAGPAAYDVPLVRGLDAEAARSHATRPTDPVALRRLLGALERHPTAAALVSEIRVAEDGTLRLRTVPDGRGRSAEVRLGTGALARKLRRLTAFWQQAVRREPRTAFRRIDLRFDGQIVARQETFSQK